MVVDMKFNMKDYSKGEAIRIIREWTNLTQQDFASRIGKSKRTVEQYEADKVNYGVEVLKTITKKFDIDITVEKKEN